MKLSRYISFIMEVTNMTKFGFSRSFDFVKKLLDFSKKYVLVKILDNSRTTFTVYTF